jgi:DNA ligase-1
MTDGFVLDGEIMSSSFQALMTQARRQSGAKADDTVFHVFDIIPLADFRNGYWNTQQRKRLEILDKIAYVIDKMANVVLVKGILVDLDTAAGRDQMDRYFSNALALGLEGIMVKDMEAPYECKRSVHWMKIKPVADFDLKVIQVVEGEGKYVGMMGALLCEGTDDGKLIRVSVGSGFSDEQRAEIWKNRRKALGQTAVVMCDAVTQSNTGEYSLRFPRFKTFRDDK